MSPFEKLHIELSKSLGEAVSHIEATGSKQSAQIEKRLKRVEEKIVQRLGAIEERQDKFDSNITNVTHKCVSPFQADMISHLDPCNAMCLLFRSL